MQRPVEPCAARQRFSHAGHFRALGRRGVALVVVCLTAMLVRTAGGALGRMQNLHRGTGRARGASKASLEQAVAALLEDTPERPTGWGVRRGGAGGSAARGARHAAGRGGHEPQPVDRALFQNMEDGETEVSACASAPRSGGEGQGLELSPQFKLACSRFVAEGKGREEESAGEGPAKTSAAQLPSPGGSSCELLRVSEGTSAQGGGGGPAAADELHEGGAGDAPALPNQDAQDGGAPAAAAGESLAAGTRCGSGSETDADTDAAMMPLDGAAEAGGATLELPGSWGQAGAAMLLRNFGDSAEALTLRAGSTADAPGDAALAAGAATELAAAEAPPPEDAAEAARAREELVFERIALVEAALSAREMARACAAMEAVSQAVAELDGEEIPGLVATLRALHARLREEAARERDRRVGLAEFRRGRAALDAGALAEAGTALRTARAALERADAPPDELAQLAGLEHAAATAAAAAAVEAADAEVRHLEGLVGDMEAVAVGAAAGAALASSPLLYA
jgi:hypothetical protein